jgi:hypothetical protein
MIDAHEKTIAMAGVWRSSLAMVQVPEREEIIKFDALLGDCFRTGLNPVRIVHPVRFEPVISHLILALTLTLL